MAKAKKPAKTPAKRVWAPLKVAVHTIKGTSDPSEAAPSSSASRAGEWRVGDHVFHPMFGAGTVTALDGETLTIKFAGDTSKQIRADFVTVRKS